MTKPAIYYSLVQEDDVVSINIFGEITSWPWSESDMSAYRLAKVLESLEGVKTIYVNINSYGGEVAEGLAIYNQLKDFPAKVITVCKGFACSAASVVFMAGDERIMLDASLLMIHQAWMNVSGNADELRKCASDLDVITSASVAAYMSKATISEDEIIALMKDETWIKPEDAVSMGFATSTESISNAEPEQSARRSVFEMIIMATAKDKSDGGSDDPDEPDEPEDPDNPDNPDDSDDSDDSGDESPDSDDGKDEKKTANQRFANFLLERSNYGGQNS